MASDTEKNAPLMKRYEGLTKHSDKLKFALQLKLDKTGNFMTASETHSAASVDKTGFEVGWMEDSMVASKLGMLI